MDVSLFFVSIVSAMLVNNVVLMKFLGICPFLGVSKKIESSIGMSVAVLFVMLVATVFTYPLYHYVLVPTQIEYLQIIVFILVIASVVQLVELIIKKYSSSLYKSLGVYLPLITTNCAILGLTQDHIINESTFSEAIVITIGTGLGFGLVMFAFSAIREKLELANVPKSFEGMPISLITAGIMSLAFLGFGGLV